MSKFEDQAANARATSNGQAPSSPFDSLNEWSAGEAATDGIGRPLGWRSHIEATSDYSAETRGEAWEYWLRTVIGVAFAGGAYGLPVFFIGGVFGFLIAGFFSLALVVPFAMAVRSVCGVWRHPLAAPCFGGLIGYVSIAGWMPLVIIHPSDFVAFALGPMLSTLVGQGGGYIATRSMTIEMILQRQQLPVVGRWQFSIGAALLGTASAALLLTLLRWWRPLEFRDFYLAAFWLPWQIGLLCLFGRIGRRAANRLRDIRRRFT